MQLLSFAISALLAATASARSLSSVAKLNVHDTPTGIIPVKPARADRANRQLWGWDKDVQDGEACGDANDGASCPKGSWCTVELCSSGKEGQTCAHGWGNADCNDGLSCISRGICARNAERGVACGDSAGNVDCVSGYWCSNSEIYAEQAQIDAGDTKTLHRCQDSFWKSGTLVKVAEVAGAVAGTALVVATGGAALAIVSPVATYSAAAGAGVAIGEGLAIGGGAVTVAGAGTGIVAGGVIGGEAIAANN